MTYRTQDESTASSGTWFGTTLAVLLAALLLPALTTARAASRGGISGKVTSAAGTPIPSVTVRVKNTATKESQTTITNSDGVYTFAALTSASYDLHIEHRNFRPYVKKALEIALDSTIRVDVQLVGASEPNLGDMPGGGQDQASGDPNPRATAPKPYNSRLLTTKGGFLHGISRREALLGDAWGVRRALSRFGISLDVLETSEVLGNVSGGVGRGAAYDGVTQLFLQLDTQRAFRWYGGTFNVSALQIRGRNLSTDRLYSLQTASGIQANPATRLWELWYDQRFGETDRFDIKIGQQSLDQEYMLSQNALLFVNTMFGWAMLPSADMPGGGPAYPLSALGVRARTRVANSWTVLAGVFNGTPAFDVSDDAQENNPSGTSFSITGSKLAIAEVQYAYPSVGTMVRGNKRTPLPRLYKFGAWYDSMRFDDQRFDDAGRSLVDPLTTSVPQTHRGNYAFYAVADQMIWVNPVDADRNVNVFVRAMGTPLTDRNLIDFSLNAGLTFNEPIWNRHDDSFGVGMGYAHVSSRAASLDRDTRWFSDPRYPIRGGETFVEVTYRYQFKSWWQWQPTFQYVFNPGAGIINPSSPSGQKVKGEAVLGLRMNFAF